MAKKPKREQWRLPKTFRPAKVKKGTIQRHDGEPRIFSLTKHENDRSLSTDTFVECCDCGLTHHHIYNVIKPPNGKWYLLVRAYRQPGTGKK